MTKDAETVAPTEVPAGDFPLTEEAETHLVARQAVPPIRSAAALKLAKWERPRLAPARVRLVVPVPG